MTSLPTNKQKSIAEQKEVAFYHASVRAWYSCALVQDIILFLLSLFGAMLNIILLMIFNVKTIPYFLLCIGAIVCFSISLFAVFFILNINKKYIEDIFDLDTDIRVNERLFVKTDFLARAGCIVGMVLTVTMVLSKQFIILTN